MIGGALARLAGLAGAAGKYAAGGLGIAAIIGGMIAGDDTQLCVSYPVAGVALLALWIAQRGAAQLG